MSECPTGWNGVTHDALYTPDNLGREFVTSLCGKRVHVTELRGFDPLTCKTCKVARLRESLRIMRTGDLNLLSVELP